MTTKIDIAKKTGVSRTAVSLILNGAPNNISQSTRKEVIETARRMGYVPQRGLSRHPYQTVGKQEMELSLWGPFEILEAVKNLVSKVEESSGIEIGLSYTTAYKGERYNSRLSQSFKSGDPPDVFWLNDGFVKFFKSNRMLDLAPLLKKDRDINPSVFLPKTWDMSCVGKHVYSLPKDINVGVVYYNKSLFDKSGIEYPAKNWRWRDFLRIADELTRPEENQFGFAYGREWLQWIWQNGGDIIDTASRKCVIDRPESIEALRFLQDLKYERGVIPLNSCFDELNSIKLFQSGKIAMTILPRWATIPFRHIKEFDWDVTFLPEGKAGLVTPLYVGHMCISKSTSHPDKAWSLLKVLSSREWQEKIWGVTGESLPANRLARISGVDDLFLPPEHQNVFLDSVSYGRVPAYFYYTEDRKIRDVLENGISRIVLSPVNAEDVCLELKQEVDGLLNTG